MIVGKWAQAANGCSGSTVDMVRATEQGISRQLLSSLKILSDLQGTADQNNALFSGK